MRRLFRGLFLVITVVLVGLTNSPQAWAKESAPVNWWKVNVNLTSDGVAHVEAELEMDFSKVNGRGPVFAFTEKQRTGNEGEWLNFGISNIQVSSPSGANSETQITRDNGTIGVRVGEKNTTYSTPQTYRISYEVTGLIATNHAVSGLDEFNWNVINGWESEIKNFQVTVTGPAAISKVACWQTKKLHTPCESNSSDASASYTVDRIPAGDPVQVVAGFPAGTFPGVTQKVTKDPTLSELLSETYSLTPATGITTTLLGAGAVAGLLSMRNRKARDEVFLGLTPGLTPAAGAASEVGKRRGKVNVAVAFQPPKGTLPGEIGTLTDATADSVDISATIVDLAVRGYLVMTALPDGDHQLTRSKKKPKDLAGYEKQLMVDIFKA